MALIKCPNCAQSVSDSAKTCPHCGAKLKEEPKNFYALPQNKKGELKTQYLSSGGVMPQDYEEVHSACIKRIKILCVISLFFIMPGTAFIGLGITVSPYFFIVAAIYYFIIGIFVFLIIRAVKKYKAALTKMVTDRVNFEKWLKDNHNLTVSWEWGSATQSYLEYKKLKQKKGLN